MVEKRKQQKTRYQGVAFVAWGNSCRELRLLLVAGFVYVQSTLPDKQRFMFESLIKEVWSWITGSIVIILASVPIVGGYMLYQSYNTVYVREITLNGVPTYTTTIKKGNESTCTWTAVGGNAAIPNKETTIAYGDEQNHYIPIYDYYDWAVVCSDNVGHTYTGKFLQQTE